jgi:mannose-6-phosphate isomerase-like protein (cupin superfamily)
MTARPNLYADRSDVLTRADAGENRAVMKHLTGSIRRDDLSEVLKAVRFRGAAFCRSELSAPWGFSVLGREFASFHIVTRGRCCLDVDGLDGRFWLSQGDLVILPAGHAHTVRDSPSSPATRLEEWPSHNLKSDAWLLYATRFIRLFAYGALPVVLVFYLIGIGASEPQTGLLLTLTLIGDTVVSLLLTTQADRIGRRRTLIVGAVLMAAAGLLFATTPNFGLLLVAGTIGVISPSGPLISAQTHHAGARHPAALAELSAPLARSGDVARFRCGLSVDLAVTSLQLAPSRYDHGAQKPRSAPSRTSGPQCMSKRGLTGPELPKRL